MARKTPLEKTGSRNVAASMIKVGLGRWQSGRRALRIEPLR
jgi:hypothetical protein